MKTNTQKRFSHQFITEEYISTDALIEKAAIWFNNNFITHDEYGVISYSFDTEEEMVEDFVKYIVGE